MKITAKAVLNDYEKRDIESLMTQIHQHDGTYRDVPLSNQFNYFSQMPTFILAYEDNLLVGLAMIYADQKPSEGIDLYVEVLPKMRRQGIATKLITIVKKISAKYHYFDIWYISEQKFLAKNPAFLANNHLKIDDEDSTYYMKTAASLAITATDPLRKVLFVSLMTKQDIVKVIALYSTAFNDSRRKSAIYVNQSYDDPGTLCLVLKKQGEIVGYCGVDLDTTAYFYGLFVAKNYQGRGYGSYFVKMMMKFLQNKGIKIFDLDVELDNLTALKTYQNVGFKVKSKIVYLKEKG